MDDHTPEQDFEDWFTGKTDPSPPAQGRAEDDPGEVFSAYLRAALAGHPEPATTPTESETH